MKIAVFGATGKTGLEVVKQSLEKGHHVTAFVRDPSRIPLQHDRLVMVTGDVFNPESVALAVQGQEAVICVLGSSDLKTTTVRAEGTVNIINAMKAQNIQRFLVITAMGTGDSWNTLSLVHKFFYATLLKSSREDHEAQEKFVMDSGLDWTIIRPSGLTEESRTGKYEVGENILAKTSRISRADVADLILKELEQNDFVSKAITITN